MEESSKVFGKMMKSQRGFGRYCLCAQCNNSTGNWYVKDFCEFTGQGLNVLEESNSPVVEGYYTIKPLNVIKQILLMFVCADTSGVLRNHKGVTDYLLNKENQNFPEKINIYLYSNACIKKFLEMMEISNFISEFFCVYYRKILINSTLCFF